MSPRTSPGNGDTSSSKLNFSLLACSNPRTGDDSSSPSPRFLDTPGFEVEQNFVPGFEDIDDGSFNEVESLPRPQRLVGESPQGNFPGKWSRFTNSQND